MAEWQAKLSAPLFFIRHGETDWNQQRRFQGQIDIPLNSHGKLQAEENATLLSRCLKEHNIAHEQLSFITSPLLRASRTTELILQKLQLPIDQYSTSDQLKEISFGLWEGLTPAEAKQQYYPERQKRRSDRWSIAPPGGESFASRVGGVKLLLQGVPACAVIVSHSGILRIVAQLLLNLPPLEAAKLETPHTGITIWDGNQLLLPGK